MEDTKITAKLPNLEIEVRKRDLPEENAEAMTIHLRAAPSFDVVGATMLPALSAFSAMNPMMIWMRAMEAAWKPWLANFTRSALPPWPEDAAEDETEDRD